MTGRKLILGLALLTAGLLALSGPALAGETPAGWTYLTLGRNFQRILADWREPYTGTKQFGASDRDDMGMEGSLGASVCLARHFKPEIERTWQIGVEAGFFALFDWAEGASLQSRATDYRVGLQVSYSRAPWSWRVSLGHLSSHPGDYHLRNENSETETVYWEDIRGLLSWQAIDWLRLYAGGAVYLSHTDDAGHGDFQAGLEFFYPLEDSRLRPYLALDLQLRDRTEWRATVSVEGGVMVGGFEGQVNLRLYGFLLNGDDPSAVFCQEETTRYGLGLNIDF
ncbi:MAG: DUF1207 domain-containing protein [Deltaproteobacteria bacterium]|nr:DUF1207 domain-containing protein [Deltaproteobacteria bacterium]